MGLPPSTEVSPTLGSGEPEEACGKTSVDGGSPIGAHPSLADDAHRLLIADRKRHIRAHHQTIGAEHLDDELQNPGIVNDAIVVKAADRFDWVDHTGRYPMVALETTHQERQSGSSH